MVTKLTMMEHALGYSARGQPVLPLHWPENGVCSCGNPNCGRSSAKHPLTPNGLKDATTNPEQIRNWWTRWPDANIGIVTGKVSGIVVVDVDAGKGGIESWNEFRISTAELIHSRALPVAVGCTCGSKPRRMS